MCLQDLKKLVCGGCLVERNSMLEHGEQNASKILHKNIEFITNELDVSIVMKNTHQQDHSDVRHVVIVKISIVTLRNKNYIIT